MSDLMVIGAGPAGCAAARHATRHGLATILVGDQPPLDIPSGVTFVHGTARLAAPGHVVVEGADRTSSWTARNLVLAPGSIPAGLAGVTVDGRLILDTAPEFAAADGPSSLVILGGGPAGVAAAATAVEAGRKVTLVEIRDRLLPGFEADLGTDLLSRLEASGVRVLTGHRVAGAGATDDHVVVTLRRTSDREKVVLEAETALLASGRRPRTRDLGLDQVDVLTDRRGAIQTDGFMATSHKGIYAVGAAVPTLGGESAAVREAETAVDHAAGGNPDPVRYDRLPRSPCVGPEIFSLGLSEAEAGDRGHLAGVARLPWPGDPGGWIKLVVDSEDGEILGLHALGRDVTSCTGWAPRLLDPAADIAAAITGLPGSLASDLTAALAAAREGRSP